MAKLSPTSPDFALSAQTGLLDANESSPWFNVDGLTNLSIWGTFVGSIILERSFDGGDTAIPCTSGGLPVTFNAAVSETLQEVERGVLYRLTASAWTSGSANYRFSR